jgi:hypothetical protein
MELFTTETRRHGEDENEDKQKDKERTSNAQHSTFNVSVECWTFDVGC